MQWFVRSPNVRHFAFRLHLKIKYFDSENNWQSREESVCVTPVNDCLLKLKSNRMATRHLISYLLSSTWPIRSFFFFFLFIFSTTSESSGTIFIVVHLWLCRTKQRAVSRFCIHHSSFSIGFRFKFCLLNEHRVCNFRKQINKI